MALYFILFYFILFYFTSLKILGLFWQYLLKLWTEAYVN
jgi:hypothetical protein